MADFDKGFELVVGIEGGYVNDPNDPGGETKYGISKRAYPGVDIVNLTLDRAKVIYKTDYWDVVKGDLLPYPLNIFVFDAAINQGADTAKKLLQKTLNLAQDGVLGPVTMTAAVSSSLWHAQRFMAMRALRYTGTRNFDINGAGWLTRLFTISMGV